MLKDANVATTASEKMVHENNGACVRIEQAENGVIVYGYSKKGPMKESTYVFNTLDEALEEVPSIMSVTKAEAKDNGEDEPMED